MPHPTPRPLAAAFLLASALSAQAVTAPPNGPRPVDPRWHALMHARLVARPGTMIEDATIVLRDGLVVSVEAGAAPPAGARVHDLRGRFVYPGLVEPHLPVEAPRPERASPGLHWNEKVTPQRRALDGEGTTKALREELRRLGYGAAAIAPRGGIFRGEAAMVLLHEPEDAPGRRATVVREGVYHTVGFETGGGYPSSLMGAIALVRQTLLDAAWRAECVAAQGADPAAVPLPPDEALAALAPGRAVPLLFDATDELDALRAAKIAKEARRPFLVLGSGLEFRRVAALAHSGAAVLVPLRFPRAPEIRSAAEAELATLRDLMAWEQGPTNARRLLAAGVRAAFTTDKLEKRGEVHAQVRKAIRHGLSEEQALGMLTVEPARLLGLEGLLGEVAPKRLANLVVCDGPLFAEDSQILDVWVGGQRYVIHTPQPQGLAGTWAAEFPGRDPARADLEINSKSRVTLVLGDKRVAARGETLRETRLSFVVADAALGAGSFAFTATLEAGALLGEAVAPDGTRFSWRAARSGDAKPESRSSRPADAADVPQDLLLPLGAYGLPAPPPQDALLLEGATLWTSGPAGIVEDGVLIVEQGRVVYAGPRAQAPPPPAGARRIDARGKHVSPGILDCHSHTGIARGVNEGSHAVTAEVRIQDVLDPDDVHWYRELAGGVTAVNQLHGSANPIGGQSQTTKLRWGVAIPDAMHMEGAKPGIKFALGENVKRANAPRGFGPPGAGAPETRYPATRMGVEVVLRASFAAARDYTLARERFSGVAPPGPVPPRRDLQLEALAEILAGERLIHCHSYRQDEILALARLAGEYGIRLGTYQHALEAYKVAPEVKDSALGASLFSDWWAYKMEVFDAIPEAGAILHEQGVVVSFNSDSDELARRLNGEAAKAVKYGGVAPADALRFVTLNPAIQLGVAGRVGSLEKGKDADFAIWSASPLSSYARCEATFVDGREYFSLAQDREHRARIGAERQRLVQKVLRGEEERRAAHGDSRPATGPRDADEEEREEARRRVRLRMERALHARLGYSCCRVEEVR
ncbi:MAG: amidohydrolase family protein [Planctomycetes bacterium]|nr:amidohydrolase family protein [Planctomycetota bacterium]